jgi:hypothetical protein
MIEDGVYDGYSCEIDPDGKGGFTKIGGSLTNYPAVHGLEPVRLEAPAFDITPPNEADEPYILYNGGTTHGRS